MNHRRPSEGDENFFGAFDPACQTDSDCIPETYYVCVENMCKHKEVFPQTNLEIAGLITFGLIMALCTVAGIGGGGVANSMLLYFWKFDTKDAVAISSFSILVCSVMRFFYNFNTKSPANKHSNVVDYSLATIMMPTTLAGSQVGAYILEAFPSAVIQILLTILLAFLSVQSTLKAYALHKQEKAEMLKKDQVRDDVQASVLTKLPMNATLMSVRPTILSDLTPEISEESRGPSFFKKEIPLEVTPLNPQGPKEQIIQINDKQFRLGTNEKTDQELHKLKAIADREQGQKQFVKQGLCLLMMATVIMVNLLLPSGDGNVIGSIKKCSPWYWLVTAILLLVCVLITIIAVKINQREQLLKVKYEVNYQKGDVLFQGSSLIWLYIVGFFGGLVAGAFGLGGGSIYNPALLAFGCHPKVAGSTGMLLVLLSTINTALLNWLNGLLNLDYALWISSFSLAGSLLGLIATDAVVRMTGKASIIVWLLVAVFILSTVSTPVFAYFSLRNSVLDNVPIWSFNDIC